MRWAALFKVGSLVAILVGSGAALGLWWWRHGAGEWRVYGRFRNTVGIVQGSAVKMAGIVIGAVEERRIEIVDRPDGGPDEDSDLEAGVANHAKMATSRVALRLRPGVVLYEDATLLKTTASLLGEYFIDVRPGTPEDRVTKRPHRQLRDGDLVADVREPTALDDLMNQTARALPELKRMLLDVERMTRADPLLRRFDEEPGRQSVVEMLRDIRGKVDRAGPEVRQMFDRARARIGEVDRAIVDNGDEVMHAIERLKEATRDINAKIAQGGSFEKGADEVRKEVDKIKEATDRFDKALGKLDDEASKLGRGEGEAGKLLKDPAIAENVEEITRSIDEGVQGFTRIKTVVGLRSEYNYFSARLKNYLAIAILPKPDKYFLLELVSDPRGFRRQTITLSDSSDPRRPHTVSEKQVTITDDFRLSFQWAKRIDRVTLRFGIKESTGGLGADFHFLRDRLEIMTDVFDFRGNVYPRLKVLAAMQFFKYLYFVGGIDDALNARNITDASSSGRDYFLGAMLRFDDEDLRGLLLLGGSAISGLSDSQSSQRK